MVHPRFALLVALGLLAAPALTQAQSKTGTTMGQFLLLEPDARIAGMGNAGVTAAQGLGAVYYNPAAVATIEGREVQFSHSEWLADIDFDHVIVAMPVGKWGNGFASITSLNSGDILVRTVAAPLGTGERYQVSNIALTIGAGRSITDRFSVGGQVSYLQETIWNSSAGTAAINIGTLYRVSENGLHIGSSLSNFGTRARYDGRDLRILYDNDPDRFGDNGTLPGLRYTDAFALPTLFRVGLGWPHRFNRDHAVHLALDAFHPGDSEESMSVGGEWAFRDLLALRAGWQSLFLPDREAGATLGAGIRGRAAEYRYHCDYAWADHGRLGQAHRLSVGITF